MRRRLHLAFLLVATALTGAVGPALRAEEDEGPADVPVEIHAEIDERDVLALGHWTLDLAFEVLEDVERPYRIQLHLLHRGALLVDLSHAPRPPTPGWKQGDRIAYRLPVPVPLETELEGGAPLDLLLGFYDPEAERLVVPRTKRELWGPGVRLARLELPPRPDADAQAHVAAVVQRAKELAAEDRKPDAWRALELGLRLAARDATKRRYRDALVDLAPYDAPPLTVLEEQVVGARIAQERRRFLRLESGRCYRDGDLFAALRLLEVVGGTLEEDVDAAVIGALAEAERTERDIVEIQRRILGDVSDEAKADAQAAIEKYGSTEKLLAKGEAWAERGRYARARIAFRHISTAGKGDLSAEALRRLEDVERAWLAQTPEDEARRVHDAMHHPAFERLATSASQRFVFIGPRKLVEGIPARSRLRFDLAYVFLTDLFGRLPNPAGDRITVYFKELWDFGGGQGGGKRIDIGQADPNDVGYRVDTGLLYHELTHCVDDTRPIYVGYREGLADMGAVYAYEAMGQEEGRFHAFRRSLEAFRRDYVSRDIPYWRIQNYAVSAGFFLHFVDAYAKTPEGHDWSPYRRFFRAYRRAPVRDAREPYLVRAFAHYLVEAFGPQVFDDLIRFRLPLRDSDRDVLAQELEAFAFGQHRVPYRAEAFAGHPSSPLPRDLVMHEVLERMRRRDADGARRVAFEKLGVIHDWRVIGPFAARGSDPRAHVFPPEYEIDFDKQYPNGLNTCKWWKTEREGVVTVSPPGWVSFNFSYQDHTATYAYAHVRVPEAQTAHVHVRANDDVALFVGGRRIADYVARGDESSPGVWWRGSPAMAPDAQRFAVPLAAGRNAVLVKIRNRYGAAGFTLALSRPDGTPIPGLEVDLDPPEPADATTEVRWRDVLDHAFRSKSFKRKIVPTVGRFKVVNKRLVGQATDKAVPWRKYTVRPGFPKDAPSNLFWIHEKHTEDLVDFRLRLDLEGRGKRGPKIAVTFQGEGGEDVLAGWTLILHPRGEGKVRARLERHEMLLYVSPEIDVPEGELVPLELALHDDRLSVRLGDARVFDRVSVRRVPERHRIGVATWGEQPAIVGFELERPKRPGER